MPIPREYTEHSQPGKYSSLGIFRYKRTSHHRNSCAIHQTFPAGKKVDFNRTRDVRFFLYTSHHGANSGRWVWLNMYERQSAIMDTLCRERCTTTANLSFLLGVCERTIRRDITTLSFRYPIRTIKGRSGGVKLEDWFFPVPNHCQESSAHFCNVSGYRLTVRI